MKSLKELVNDIETFCTAHQMIKTFKYGDFNVLNDDKDFKPVQVECYPTTANNAGKTFTTGLDVAFLDKCKDDFSNLLNIHSKTLEAANDLINTFVNGDESLIAVRFTYTVELTNFEPITSEKNNRLHGWLVSFEVSQFNNQDGCNVPI